MACPVIGMKMFMVMAAVLAVLLAGCLQPPGAVLQNQENPASVGIHDAPALTPDSIYVQQDGPVSTIGIEAQRVNDSWRFPLGNYPDEFRGVSLYNERFIQLNKTQIPFLEEGESVWLTPAIQNGSGVLVNALYSKKFQACHSSNLSILGKSYARDELIPNADLPYFRNDDRWQVRFEQRQIKTNVTPLSYDMDFCDDRLVIFLNGYFDNIKEGEEIHLFRNDNTLLLKFVNLGTKPRVEVIATRPTPLVTAQVPVYPQNFSVMDWDAGINYTETVSLNSTHLEMRFEPAIPVCSRPCYEEGGFNNDYTTDTHHLVLTTPSGNWSIARLRYANSSQSTELALGFETWHGILNLGESFPIDNYNYTFLDMEFRDDYLYDALFCKNESSCNNSNVLRFEQGKIESLDSKYLKIWYIAPGYTFAARWVKLSAFSDIANVTDPSSNATLVWVNGTTENPALKSILVPRSSPIFQKLAGNP